MTKILFFTFLIMFLSSCSSNSKRSYIKDDMEGRADQLSITADRYRQQEKLKDAYQYYLTASEIYLLKGCNSRFLLIKLKMSMLLLKEKKVDQFIKLIDQLTLFNKYEMLGLEQPINYVKSRYLYYKGDRDAANVIMQELISYYNESPEQKSYYLFFYASNNLDQLTNSELRELEKTWHVIMNRYRGGSLLNEELLPFASIVMSRAYLKYNDSNRALEQIGIADKIHIEMELSSKRDTILELYRDYYLLVNNTDKSTYYTNMLLQLRKLKKKYN